MQHPHNGGYASHPMHTQGTDPNFRGKIAGTPTGGVQPEPAHPEYHGGPENSGIFEKYDVSRTIAKLPYGCQYACKERRTGATRTIQVIDKRFCVQDKIATAAQAVVESKGFKEPDHAEVHRNTLDLVRQELQLLAQLNHQNLGRVTEYLEDQANFYVVCEAVSGGDFETLMGSGAWMDEHNVGSVVRQTILATHYCHQRQIIHRDIRPGCIYRTSSAPEANIKVMEFGQAQLLKNMKAKFDMTLDPAFLAPEVLRGKTKYETSCDMWSIGVTMYFLLCGALPFPVDHSEARLSMGQMSKKLSGFRIEFPPELHWERRSRPARDLLRHLLVLDTKGRLTAGEALHSEWISLWGTPPPLVADPYRVHWNMVSRCCLMNFNKLGKEGFEELYDRWDEIDTSKDGMITTDQLRKEIRRRGKVTDERDIEALVRAADTENNETCMFQEYVAVMLFEKLVKAVPAVPKNVATQRLGPGSEGATHLARLTFDNFDKNRDGLTTKAEMAKTLEGPVMRHFEAKTEESVSHDILEDFPDKGEIDFQTFFETVASMSNQHRPPNRYGSVHHEIAEPCVHACGIEEEHHIEYHENTDDIHDAKPHHWLGCF